ncbi:hypothetical protein WBP07_11845 [Novosphingobium sp. BL-8A]|uniref:hypothetical protein n=1 Tax=Novosphingobium sp. BL-8A TaxID=3127639 RepID=UPI003756B149
MTLAIFRDIGCAVIAAMVFGGSIAHANVLPESTKSAPSDAQTVLAADREEGLTGPLPDLAVATGDLGYEGKYVVFHKLGVTEPKAEEDLRFCWRFLPHGMMRETPSFVAWRQHEKARPVDYSFGMYGLIGAGMGAIIKGPLERSIRQMRFYSCMLPRGYVRYRTSEAVWTRLNDDDHPERSILLQARIAAGPVPPTEKVLK